MSLRLVDDNYTPPPEDEPEQQPVRPRRSNGMAWFIGFCIGVILVAVLL